jgi:DNA-binding winged helix-turn-helix (wHTH) protein/Flp pilus assembly protein TadD
MDLTRGFHLGSITVEPLNGCIFDPDHESHHLAPKAIAVLIALAEGAPETVSREHLLDQVWGRRYVSDEVLTHAITELRHALGDDSAHPEYIETIPKCGYRLLKAVRPTDSPREPAVAADKTSAFAVLLWRGLGLIQHNRVFSVLALAGIVTGLTVILESSPDDRDDLLNRTREDPGTVPGTAAPNSLAGRDPGHNASSEFYLQAQSLAEQVTVDGTGRAERFLKQALSADSRNAPAWDLLGRIYFRQAGLFHNRPVREGAELARQAIRRALAIDPLYGPAHADLAFVNLAFDYDFDAAYRHLRQAQDLTPADPHVLRVAARMEMTHAHLDHAIDLLERSANLDPKSCLTYSALGQAYYFAHRLEEAEKSLETSLLLNPDAVRTRYMLGLVWLAQDEPRPALIAMEEEIDEGFRLIGTAIARHTLGDKVESDEALEGGSQMLRSSGPYQVAIAYAFRGQHDKALDWLELAYDSRDGDLTYLLVDPLLHELRSDMRWNALVEKLALPHQI